MPDDTFQIPDIPTADEDLLAPTEERFYACALCALQSGSRALCADCQERRSEHSETGRTRRPLYRSLGNDIDRVRYIEYLRVHRDGFEAQAPITSDDLDREFPDRHEERLQGTCWGAIEARRSRMHAMTDVGANEDVFVARNSYGMLSFWNRDVVVSQITPQRETTDQVENRTSRDLNCELAVTVALATMQTQGLIPRSMVMAAIFGELYPDLDPNERIDTSRIARGAISPWEDSASDSGSDTQPVFERLSATARFDREIDIQDGLTRLPEPPAPRAARPKIDPNVLRYLSKPGNKKTEAAYRKVFGLEGEEGFATPSRFEKINWSDE